MASDETYIPRPTCVSALLGLRVCIVAAGMWHTAALTESGDVYTWGGNESGQLGLGHTRSSRQPSLVEHDSLDAAHVVRVSCGSRCVH